MFKFIIILVLFYSSTINCLNLCGVWNQYKDIKCIKVLEKKGSEEEALNNCYSLGQTSKLVTIHSKDEQQFLNNILLKYKNITKNVWIGLKYTDRAYRWIDGSESNYTNWSEDAVKDGTDQCVQMSLSSDSVGKWTDMSCKKPALIVCQKIPEISLDSLKNVIENITQELKNSIERQQDQIVKQQQQINSMIPLGFLYTQFPNQSTPQQLWPNMNWSEVTEEYAGLFFRAEGKGSEKFGSTQSANYSRISTLRGQGYILGIGSWELRNDETHELKEGWSEMLMNYHGWHDLQLYTTRAENRPRNTAIKIWKRVQ